MEDKIKNSKNIVLFENAPVRRVWVDIEQRWYFAIVDVIKVLTNSKNPNTYWRVMKKRLKDEGFSETVTNCNTLKVRAKDGKMRKTDTYAADGLFRIIQSIPSKKAEPFKMWLAKVGYERLQETADPEIMLGRMRQIYKQKGYPQDWIDRRMSGMAIRQQLVDEWKNRGAPDRFSQALLTNKLLLSTFDMTEGDYKELKGIEKGNLRDHMTELETVLTMLAESTTTELTRIRDSKGLEKLKDDAEDGGIVASDAREEIERLTGKSVSTSDSALQSSKQNKILDKTND